MGPGHLEEGKHLIEHGPDLPLVDELVCALRLVGIGEMRTEDLLLPHPQVPDVELEVEAGSRAADDDLAEFLGDEDAGREGLLSDVLENDVYVPSRGELADAFSKPLAILRAQPRLLGGFRGMVCEVGKILAIDP